MRRITSQIDEAIGQDSFLDIVTNIVGILIILVMVVGVRTKDSWIAAAVAKEDGQARETIDVETPRRTVQLVEADVLNIAAQIKTTRRESDSRRAERDRLHTLVTVVERRLDGHRDQLDAASRQQYDLARDLDHAQSQLKDLDQKRQAVDRSAQTPAVIHHLPTPLAKTVFGKEEHFRLLGRRLAYVPLNALVKKLEDQWQAKLWKLKQAPKITETIGPLGGFHMKYTVRRTQHLVQTNNGPVRRQGAEVERFVLVPVSSDLGEPLQSALQDGSEFRRILNGLDPQQTTITIWTYPDSFREFRDLKLELYKLGFVTAGRPLPEGHPIGGSSSGTRSSAE